MSQTAMLLPSSSAEKNRGPCGMSSAAATMGSWDHVTRYCSQGEKSMRRTRGWKKRLCNWKEGPPYNLTPCRWRVAMYVPSGDHETYNSVRRFCYVRQCLSGKSSQIEGCVHDPRMQFRIVKVAHASVLRLHLRDMLHIGHGQDYQPAKRGGAPVAHKFCCQSYETE
jgi:hypothetical protein